MAGRQNWQNRATFEQQPSGMALSEFSSVRFKGDEVRASAVYQGVEPLTPEDIAETLVWMASRPTHVNIDELVIKPTDQAAIHKVYRRSPGG